MKRRLKHNAKYEEPGNLLTLSQCRQQLFTSLFFTALTVVTLGALLATPQHRSRYSVLTICFWGVFWAISLLQSWKQYRLIKQGVAVYVTSPKPLPLPKLVSVPVVLALSVIVFVIDAMAVFIAGVRIHTLVAWVIAVAVMLPLTSYAGYCWYRIAGEHLPPRETL